MKIRGGFVSNSSSSSFICDYCGNGVAGYDICRSDYGVVEFTCGHMVCGCSSEGIAEQVSVKDVLSDMLENSKKSLEKCKKEEANLNDNSSTWAKNYYPKEVLRLQNEEIPEIEERLNNPEYTMNDFMDDYEDYFEDNGFPKEFCPVCKRLKNLEQDPEWETYKTLLKKFDHVDSDGCSMDISIDE